MAWNEPGNNDNDPWGNKNKNNNNDGPPDFDEILKNIFGKFSGPLNGGGPGGTNNSGRSPFPLIAIAVVVILAVAYVIKGFGVVNEQEKAVILRFGLFHETKDSGLRWNPPLIDRVFTENVTRVRVWATNEQMLTKDLNIVDIKLSVQYVIADAKDFILNVNDPETSLKQAANSALRHVVGSTEMHNVLTEGRTAISIETAERLQAYLDSYNAGIYVEKVNVEDANPPKQVQDAFDDVIRAREDEERYKNEAEGYANDRIPRAKGAAKRVVEEAKAYRNGVVARAEGEARRFELLLAEYERAPEVTRKRLYLDAVQNVMTNTSKIMVDVEGGNNMMYLPLDKLIETSSRSVPVDRSIREDQLDRIVEKVTDKIRREAPISTRRGGR